MAAAAGRSKDVVLQGFSINVENLRPAQVMKLQGLAARKVDLLDRMGFDAVCQVGQLVMAYGAGNKAQA